MSSLEKCLFISSVHLLIVFFFFFILSCIDCLYILEINPLSVTLFANIFSHSVGCLFVLFMVSFAVQKHYCNFFFFKVSDPYSFYLFIYLFVCFWLCWVFVSVRGLSLVAASRGHSSLRCAGLSLTWPLLLRSTGSRRAGSVVVAHGPSYSAACGIFPDQGSNPCPLHWQADSQPLHHQGSPVILFEAK